MLPVKDLGRTKDEGGVSWTMNGDTVGTHCVRRIKPMMDGNIIILVNETRKEVVVVLWLIMGCEWHLVGLSVNLKWFTTSLLWIFHANVQPLRVWLWIRFLFYKQVVWHIQYSVCSCIILRWHCTLLMTVQ
jgi:hypothetical protein